MNPFFLNHGRKLQTILAYSCLIALTACNSADRKHANQMTSYSARASASATPHLFTIPPNQMSHVQVVTIQPRKWTRTLRLTGTVAYNAFNTTPVIPQIGGPVTRILVVPGQHVKAGQPMLDVSSPDYSHLRDSYVKAADSFHLAETNYVRAQNLYRHQAIALRDLEQAQSDRNQAQADLNAAADSMRILGIKNPAAFAKISNSTQIPVLAPIGGEVVERMVSPGQVVQAGLTQAFTISNLNTVWVLANIYQSDLAFIHNGDPVIVQTDAYPDNFHGRISYISPALDPNTRTLQARIIVNNPGGKLKKDMYCTVIVTAGSIANAITVPDSSVLHDSDNQPFVYVEQGTDQFGRRDVDVGTSQDGATQILKGISAGERVAGDGSLFLQFANSLQASGGSGK